MMRPALVYIILFLHLFLNNATAQQRYFFTNYTTGDGLSNPAVHSIVKDKEGYVWVGTEAGLNRFNGYRFETYRSLASDSATLPSNMINHLFVDGSGLLWISTFQGIGLYDQTRNNFIRVPLLNNHGEKFYSFECAYIMEDAQHNLWACSNGFGLVQYDKDRKAFIKSLPNESPYSDDQINYLSTEPDGTLWLITYRHLIHFNPLNKQIQAFENKVNNTAFQALNIIQDANKKNILWIGTWGSGIVKFDKLTHQFNSYKYDLNGSPNLHNIINDVQYANENELWMATSQGLVLFNTRTNSYGSFIRDSIQEKSVVNTAINCIYKDNEEILWFGTAWGLSNINPERQNFLKTPLWNLAPVHRFYYDEDRQKIYGIRYYSDRVLVIFDVRTQSQSTFKIPHANELLAEPFSITKDNNGLIWIGTSKGIYTFNEKSKTFSLFNIEKQLGIPDRAAAAGFVFKDSGGFIWFSCFGRGMIRINPDSGMVKAYFHDPLNESKFPFKSIVKFCEAGNKLYICDESNGIIIMDLMTDKMEMILTSEKKYAMLAVATDMVLDKGRNIWVTTLNSGLIRIDTLRKLSAFTKDEFGNLVTEQRSIVVDHNGMVWLTADQGIYRFDPGKQSFILYNTAAGLPVRTIGEPIQVLRDGSIVYTFNKGLYRFYPEQILKSEKKLKVHLSSFAVNGKQTVFSNYIDAMDTITLIHNENNLTIEFAAINFTDPHSSLYSFMLEGAGDIWSSPSHTRIVNFSGLNPGDYRLRIRAGVSDLSGHAPEKSIFIQIMPAWWQTSYFRWFVFLSAIAGLYFITRFFLSLRYRQQIARLEQQRAIENIRGRISRDIHDEIGAGLTKIKLMSRNLLKVQEQKENLLNTSRKISSESDELIQNLGEIVWTVNPANDSLENIFAYLRNYISKTFEDNPGVSLKLDFTEPESIPKNMLINPEIKRNVLLIVKEIITNILKHARAAEVQISLHADKSFMHLDISDDGRGFTAENVNGMGNGLNNIRSRSESMNALLEVSSSPERGTRITLEIPLRES